MTQLQPVADGVWTVTTPFRVFGLELGNRMTVLRTDARGLLLYSPVRFNTELGQELAELGEVREILLPSKMHHLHVAPYLERFPEARLFGPPGLAGKRPDLRFHALIDGDSLQRWPGCEPIFMGGMPALEEIALLHEPSGTLVVADLAFNIRDGASWWTRTYLRVSQLNGFGQSKVVKFAARDRPALRRSVDRMLGSGFDRVIVAHGDILETGGQAAMSQAFAWL